MKRKITESSPVADRAAGLATRECLSAPTRELAQRLSGTVEVLLLWHPEIERVDLSVHDPTTDTGFHVEVAPSNALDAFYHPYAYAPRRESSHCVDRAETTVIDG